MSCASCNNQCVLKLTLPKKHMPNEAYAYVCSAGLRGIALSQPLDM